MILAIHQPQYMPWLGYFHKMASADMFVLLDNVQYKKNEWQHRNRIRNSQGWQWLSVPTTHTFGQRINEVVVMQNGTWQKKHMRSLEMCYAKARYYAEYIHLFADYYSQKHATLDSVTVGSVKLLSGIMKIATPIEISSAYDFPGTSTERLVNICRHFGADTYLAGVGGRDYMDISLFEKEGIAVEFQQFAAPAYKQHWSKTDEDFIANLSAIDLIFNCGPDSYSILMENQ